MSKIHEYPKGEEAITVVFRNTTVMQYRSDNSCNALSTGDTGFRNEPLKSCANWQSDFRLSVARKAAANSVILVLFQENAETFTLADRMDRC